MRILVTGATGFIGRHLCAALVISGHEVAGVSRDPVKALRRSPLVRTWYTWEEIWKGRSSPLGQVDAVIHLAGETLSSLLWSERKKKRIMQSRLLPTGRLVEALNRYTDQPLVYIQASGVGYYGSCRKPCTENHPPASDFISHVVQEWEKELEKLPARIRTVIIRLGIVLGQGGGVLSRLVLPYRFYLGTVMGKGDQGVSWVHIDDVTGSVLYLLRSPGFGIFNVVSPNPVSMEVFSHTLGKTLGRPVWLRFPEWMIQLFMGEAGVSLLLSDQWVEPDHLVRSGYRFRYPEIESALHAIFHEKPV